MNLLDITYRTSKLTPLAHSRNGAGMSINWTFVLGATVVIVNTIVALADPSKLRMHFLQGGVAWPVNLVAVFGMIVLRIVK